MASKTIVLKGQGVRREAVANAAITPGMLVEIMSTGKIRKHATAGGNMVQMFAVEDDLQGNGISTDYAASSIAQYNVMQRGDEVFALLKNGETAVIGSLLESDGAGQLQVHVADDSSSPVVSNQIVGVAVEAVDMSGSSGADPSGRIKVMIA